jgi:hypothetical protein
MPVVQLPKGSHGSQMIAQEPLADRNQIVIRSEYLKLVNRWKSAHPEKFAFKTRQNHLLNRIARLARDVYTTNKDFLANRLLKNSHEV